MNGSTQLSERDRRTPTPDPAGVRRRVAYVMSRFPRLSETFVLFEMLALEEEGVEIEVYPLIRTRASVVHAEAEGLVDRARYLPFVSWPILRSQLALARRSPRAYFGALAAVLRGTFGSANFFFGGLAIFPKVAHVALLLGAEGVTHVHCHFSNHPAVAGFVIHRLTGIPYSFTAHGFDLHVERRMLRQKVAEAAFVVTVSEYNRELIVQECGDRYADKVSVVHCGVDTRVFRPSPHSPAVDGPLAILAVGGLEEVKGHRFLVEACRLLAAEGVDFACRIVGTGPRRRGLERQIASAGLGGRVVLEGDRTRAEVLERLREADVLVAPSVRTSRGRREGIPVVCMEAMASGVPVVASRLSGIPELVEDGRGGVLVPPGDPRAIALAIRRLRDDPGLARRLAAEGRRKVEAEFDVRSNARRLESLFEAAGRA